MPVEPLGTMEGESYARIHPDDLRALSEIFVHSLASFLSSQATDEQATPQQMEALQPPPGAPSGHPGAPEGMPGEEDEMAAEDDMEAADENEMAAEDEDESGLEQMDGMPSMPSATNDFTPRYEGDEDDDEGDGAAEYDGESEDYDGESEDYDANIRAPRGEGYSATKYEHDESNPNYEAYARYCEDMGMPMHGAHGEETERNEREEGPERMSSAPKGKGSKVPSGGFTVKSHNENYERGNSRPAARQPNGARTGKPAQAAPTREQYGRPVDSRTAAANGKPTGKPTVRPGTPPPGRQTVRGASRATTAYERELETRLKQIEMTQLVRDREADLVTLRDREGIILDVDEELKDVVHMGRAQYERHIERITTRYERDLTKQSEIPTDWPLDQEGEPIEFEDGADETGLTMDDALQVHRYARQHKIDDHVEAVQSYMRDKFDRKRQGGGRPDYTDNPNNRNVG